MREYKWQLQGRGLAKLLQHCTGAEFFHFWQHDLLVADDVRVGDSGLVLRTCWSWRTGMVVDRSRLRRWTGRVRACGAFRFARPCSQVLRRVDGLRGEGLGIPSPHLGSLLQDTSCSSCTGSSFGVWVSTEENMIIGLLGADFRMLFPYSVRCLV